MRFSVEALPGYLRFEVVQRETAEEARAVAESILAEQAKTGVKKLLIVVRESRPIFRVEQWNFSEVLNRLAAIGGLRMALVSDTSELQASQEYVEVLTKQRGIDVRSFRDEASALKWLVGDQQKAITAD